MLKATCPNDPTHKTFITVAHVTEDWVVDEHGHFLHEPSEEVSMGAGECTHPPHKDNTWSCEICGAEANVEEVDE